MTHWLGNHKPLIWVIQFWPALLLAMVVSLLATWLCRNIALRAGLVDIPDDQIKTHTAPVAYLGGIGILCGILAGVLTGGVCLLEPLSRISMVWLIMLSVGAMVACAVGVADDILDLSPKRKLLGQILAATFLVLAGIHPNLQWLGDSVPETVQTVLSVLLVYVFVIGATNSLNLLDGLDGLCAGTTSIMTTGMLLLSIHWATWGVSDIGDPVRLILCVATLGGVLGFLPFNRHPAKIFMGDAGSLLLGYCMAVIMILFAQSAKGCLASIMIFGLPVLDTTVAVARRRLNHRPLFESDRGHVYDQIMDRGTSLKKTVALCYCLSAIYVIIGLALPLMPQLYSLLLACLVVVVSGVTVWQKGFLKMKGLRGAIQK